MREQAMADFKARGGQRYTEHRTADIVPIVRTTEQKRISSSRSPLVSDLKGEMRTFRCKACGEDTKIIDREPNSGHHDCHFI
jgi:hypothetical protein